MITQSILLNREFQKPAFLWLMAYEWSVILWHLFCSLEFCFVVYACGWCFSFYFYLFAEFHVSLSKCFYGYPQCVNNRRCQGLPVFSFVSFEDALFLCNTPKEIAFWNILSPSWVVPIVVHPTKLSNYNMPRDKCL